VRGPRVEGEFERDGRSVPVGPALRDVPYPRPLMSSSTTANANAGSLLVGRAAAVEKEFSAAVIFILGSRTRTGPPSEDPSAVADPPRGDREGPHARVVDRRSVTAPATSVQMRGSLRPPQHRRVPRTSRRASRGRCAPRHENHERRKRMEVVDLAVDPPALLAKLARTSQGSRWERMGSARVMEDSCALPPSLYRSSGLA